MALTECPLKTITPDVWDAAFAANLAEKGTWPIGGGWLEQSRSLVSAVQAIWSERARCEEQLMAKHGR